MAGPGWASQSVGRPGGRGTRESLGTELGEARAESRRGRTFPGLIAEGGLSHGVHVRAQPREGKESLGNELCSGEKVRPQEGAATEKSWKERGPLHSWPRRLITCIMRWPPAVRTGAAAGVKRVPSFLLN